MLLSSQYALEHIANPSARPSAPFDERCRRIVNNTRFEEAWREIVSWPGYAPTPLRPLTGLAAASAIEGIWYKDEAGRFGLGSFKALGGAYAVLRLLARETGSSANAELTAQNLIHGDARSRAAAITVTCATDGNHGRSVAWGAQQFGCRCVIYIHATVSEARRQAIAQYGAEVVRVAGTYDDAIRRAAADARANGWFVVSDTSYSGYMDVPRDVMQGYTVMAAEALSQLPPGESFTHVFLQGGVGGLAAAVCGHLWESLGPNRPRIVVVEPEKAACLFESARKGVPTSVGGDLDTIMAGLACGEVSLLAWEILRDGADDFLTIPDEAAADCMRLLAKGVGDDSPIVAGESAVAGLAGLLLARSRPDMARRLHLESDSRVLLIGSEGATDAEVYTRIVGRSPEAAARGAQ